MTGEDRFEVEYAAVSAVLLEYGCMVAPYLLGGEWRALRAYCENVRVNAPATSDDRARVERELDELLASCVYHPTYRAFYVHRAITLPHMKEVSHLLERAVMQYFKHDYLSCMLCLLPAAEGALRSYAGWSFGGPKLPFADLVARIRGGTAETYPRRHALYGGAMAGFLERWLYRPTKDADFGLSFLNRHYALHGLGPETFYRATDCHRLLLFFDLFADLLTLEGHGEKHVWIPDDIPEMNRRREHYERLIGESATLAEVRVAEDALLREHSRFIPEPHPLRLEEVVARWAHVMGLT